MVHLRSRLADWAGLGRVVVCCRWQLDHRRKRSFGTRPSRHRQQRLVCSSNPIRVDIFFIQRFYLFCSSSRDVSTCPSYPPSPNHLSHPLVRPLSLDPHSPRHCHCRCHCHCHCHRYHLCCNPLPILTAVIVAIPTAVTVPSPLSSPTR